MQVAINVADSSHEKYAQAVCNMIEGAAINRGTGIAKRKPEYIREKIHKGNAVIALNGDEVVGFCYIESWEGQKFVANSGLIVHPEYRKTGLAKKIKSKIFMLSVKKFPDARLFGITTSLAVMKINSALGYQPVTFSELTADETFWKGCKSCSNYDILKRTGQKMCLCTGMVCNIPARKKKGTVSWEQFKKFLKTHGNHFPLMNSLYPKISKILNK